MITDTPSGIALGSSAESRTDPMRTLTPTRKARVSGWLKFATAVISAGLLGFNAWWYWRDTRSVASSTTISQWIVSEQYGRAEGELRELLRRAPHDGEARTMLARVLAARNDLRGCAQQLHLVPFWWPSKAEALYREGQAAMMRDRAKDAEACWLAVVEDDPLHPRAADLVHDARQELLKLYSTEERWEELRDILWEAYEDAGPDDRFTLLTMRVRSELERIAPEATIVQLEAYVAADPTDIDALRGLARAELSLNHKEDARRHYQACLASSPANPRVWRDYLMMLHNLGDREALVSLLAKIPSAAEAEPEVWSLRGLLKENTGDWVGAKQDYSEASRRNPFLLSVHYRLAMVEERLGHRDSAAKHRRSADLLRGAQSELRTAYNNVIAAEEAREKKTYADPDLPTAMKRLASICETLGWARVAEAWNQLAEPS